MKVTHNVKKLNPNKRKYECFGCGVVFNWSVQSRWFGSYADLENQPDKIQYYCSLKCK